MSKFKNIQKKSRHVLLFFLFFLIGCSRSGQKINLFYSGNLSGIVEYCACPKATEGTILNHYTFYRDSVKNGDSSYYISAGNLFAYSKNDSENLLIGEIAGLLGYDLIFPGRNDFQFTEKFSDMAVSFNIEGAAEYRLLKKKGLRISLTGMADPSFNRLAAGETIKNRSMEEIMSFISGLKARSDIVIFISNLDPEFEREVFMKIKDIDVLISVTGARNEAYSFGDRYLISTGHFGENIGILTVKKTGSDISFKNRFVSISRRLFRDDPEMRLKTDELRKKYGIELEEYDSILFDL